MIRALQRMGWRLSAFALLALLVRALTPAGYMLAEADTGSGRYLTLEFCDAHAGKAKVVDLDTGKIIDAPVKGKSSGAQPPCVFCSTIVAVASPEPAARFVRFIAAQDVDFSEIPGLRPGRGIAAPPPPATGPPQHI